MITVIEIESCIESTVVQAALEASHVAQIMLWRAWGLYVPLLCHTISVCCDGLLRNWSPAHAEEAGCNCFTTGHNP